MNDTIQWVHTTARHAQRWHVRLGRRLLRGYEAVNAFAIWLLG